ncbi:hypothetical protein [Polaromonas sp. 35-63-35]|uniref:hypothetical protein n=1 Tax=Polaromonas sp. 35-63-35 TaxID=1970418 RepID=UPI0025DC9E1C|nr:hypothetical protein [Polaromonas sp. 35-63-35]
MLLLIPGLNWIVGTLFAGRAGVRLLSRGHLARLLGLLAGATLWSILSFYLLLFWKHPLLAALMMLVFFGGTWFLLMLIEAWDMPDEPARVSLTGRIQS